MFGESGGASGDAPILHESFIPLSLSPSKVLLLERLSELMVRPISDDLDFTPNCGRRV